MSAMLHSPQNIAHLRGILCDFFRSRYGADISTVDLDPVLLRAAAQVGAAAHEGTPLPELNKQVLRVAREAAMAALPPKEETMEGLMLRRQRELEAIMPQRPPPVPIPTPVAPPTAAVTPPPQTVVVEPPRDSAFFISSASRDTRREPGPCRFTLSAAAGRAPHQAFQQVYTNCDLVPGTTSAYIDGYPNTHGFVLNGQTFAAHMPDAERGRVHAMCATQVLPPPASGLPLDAARLRVARIMIGVHNRPSAPACVQVGGTALYVLDRECAGHAVYLPVGAEAAEVRVANGRAEVDVTLPHQDGPAVPLQEGERVTAVTPLDEEGGVSLRVPGGGHDVRVRDVVQLSGACVYTLPGSDEELTRALNAWLASPLTVVAVREGGEVIVVDGSGMPSPLREALRAFPHDVSGLLTRPLNQVALLCSRRV